jgi:hypothetical protein
MPQAWISGPGVPVRERSDRQLPLVSERRNLGRTWNELGGKSFPPQEQFPSTNAVQTHGMGPQFDFLAPGVPDVRLENWMH